jgi:nitroreductase
MELDGAIKGRRSIRKYKKGAKIPKEHIVAMIEAASWAPSSTNVQPWRFIVVTATELIAKMSQTVFDAYQELSQRAYDAGEKRVAAFCRFMRSYGGFFADASAVVVACTKRYDISRFGLDEYDLMEKVKQLKGPDMEAILLRSVEKSVAMATQNLLLKAHELGYGTCIMDSPLAIEAQLRKMLNIEEALRLVFVIPLGIPDQEPQAPPRLPVEEVLRII